MMNSYLSAELVREQGKTVLRVANAHPSKPIVSIEPLPWFYSWNNGSVDSQKVGALDLSAGVPSAAED
jgi:hypothetical protein